MTDLSEDLRRRLGRHERTVRAEWDARPAAVLIPLYEEQGAWSLLLTRRTDDVGDHRGQVSFPGGRIDPHDSGPEEAALREAQEEIGLEPKDVELLGRLDSLLTVTQFLITPVVAKIPWPYRFTPNPTEVAEVFGVPITWLSNPANLEARRRQPLIPGRSVLVYYFRPFHGNVLWGASARLTLSLLDILGVSPLPHNPESKAAPSG